MEDRLKGYIGCCRSIDSAPLHSWGNADATDLSAQTADKSRSVGGVIGGQIRDLRGDDVVEDTEPGVHCQTRR